MKTYMRKVSKNEILKAMECYDRYPYIPFWYIIKEISQHPGIAAEDLNYWFKYGYGHADKKQIMRAYDPSQEMQEIYKHMENYINRKENNLPIYTTLHERCSLPSMASQHLSFLGHQNDYMPECMSYNEYQQALKERNYWREARKFINKNTPQQYGNNWKQQQNLRQARKFGRQAYKLVGDIIAKNNWSNTSNKAVGLHGIVGGIIAQMCGQDYLEGEALGKLNKYIVGTICQNEIKLSLKYNETLALSEEIGARLGQALGLGKQLGKEIAKMATKWNALEHNDENQYRTNLENKIKNHEQFNSLDIDIDASSNTTLEGYYNGLVATYGDSNTATPAVENNTNITKDPVATAIPEAKQKLYDEQYADKISQSLKGAVDNKAIDGLNLDYKQKVVDQTPNPIFGDTTANEEYNKKYNFIQSDFDAEKYIKNGGLAYWHNNKNQLNNFDPRREDKKRLATTILTGLNQPLTNNTVDQTIKILDEDNSQNPIAELGRTIKESDLIYVDANVSASKLALLMPGVPTHIKEKMLNYLSANISFIYSHSLDDIYVVGSMGGGVGASVGASVSFIHLPEDIKELQKKAELENDAEEKSRLKAKVKEKTEEVLQTFEYEANGILGVGAKGIILKDGRKMSGLGFGFNVSGVNSDYTAQHTRSMQDTAQENYEDYMKGAKTE